MAERQQVKYEPGQVALSNQIQRAGQYSVAVQQTPKTNSALEFAKAINQAPQLYGQAVNIRQKQAAQDVAQLSREEIEAQMANNDKETLSILGYDKAFQHSLVKRYVSLNEATITKRFSDLSVNPAEYADADKFDEALTNESNKLVEELTKEFGGNVHREEAINAISGVVLDQLISETTDTYLENKRTQTLAMKATELGESINTVGVSKAMTNYKTELAALNIAPAEISKELVTAVESNVATLVLNGEYTKASEVVEQAGEFELFKGATLGGSADNRKRFVALKKTIQTAIEADEFDFEDNSKGVGYEVDIALNTLAITTLSMEQKQKAMKRAAIRAGVSETDAESAFENVTDVQGFQAAWTRLATETTNETTRNLLGDQLTEINRQFNDYFSAKPSTIGTFTADDMAQLEASHRRIKALNPLTPQSQLPITINGRKVNVADPAFIDMVARVDRDFEWVTVDSQLKSIIKDYQSDITNTKTGFSDFGTEYGIKLHTDMMEAAPKLYKEAKGDIGQYEGLLQQKASELTSQYRRRADLRVMNEDRLLADLPGKDETRADEQGEKTKLSPSFKSFRQGTVKISELIDDRKALDNLDMSALDIKRLKQYSLRQRGFPNMASFDLELMRDTQMGYADVLLGNEVLQKMLPAFDGYQAKENGSDPTPEQEKSMKFWEGYGFDSLEDFITVDEMQTNLRLIRERM